MQTDGTNKNNRKITVLKISNGSEDITRQIESKKLERVNNLPRIAFSYTKGRREK